ncbi:MucR family transcriptional regulator [Azospirillum argentinense]|uniref:Transcriptional regulator n=1 Tax=Azospirillum brasilense TaxID=192 RepID=A0A4D8QEW0_AZOBR|nr:MucR family transcriptional regulator [Azospirillum argentinense]QCO07393.1 transcriptional regulator [Azospirillum argentinense]
MNTAAASDNAGLQALTAQVVAAYVGNHNVAPDKIPDLVSITFGALATVGHEAPKPEPVELRPAVPVKKSVMPDYIVCLEDGKKLKMLKRYLRTAFGMTPEEYRAKWGLPADYPMTAPNYAAKRSEFAKQIGLGKKH